jgi:hypothetical protein
MRRQPGEEKIVWLYTPFMLLTAILNYCEMVLDTCEKLLCNADEFNYIFQLPIILRELSEVGSKKARPSRWMPSK